MGPAARKCAARPFTHSTTPVPIPRTIYHASCRSSVKVGAATDKHRVVLLGTPEVAADVLKDLLAASQLPDSQFEVALVVSQPGKPRGRGNRGQPLPSAVEAAARDSGLIAPDQIVCPHRASEEPFLQLLSELRPSLAITAAYGNMLPQSFLNLPHFGTLNIHPSLLPAYRGAAPVQRAVQDGVAVTGVSVAYTVLACDAGPVLAQEEVAVDPNVTAPELLSSLFARGSQLLLSRLPDVWAGRAEGMAVPQDESRVLHAPKLRREEGVLDFHTWPAATLHNRVRAFAGWPGTSGVLEVVDESTGATEGLLDVKIIRTRAPPSATGATGIVPVTSSPPADVAAGGAGAGSGFGGSSDSGGSREVVFGGDVMRVPCAGGTWLEVLQVQPPTKKVMSARDFKNGLRGKRLMVLPVTMTT